MKLTLWAAAIGALLAMPLAALARQAASQADPADPRVAVPPVVYESIFSAVPAAGAAELTPDKAWRAANEAVAGTQGHAGHGASATPAPAVKPVDRPAADDSKHH